MSEPPRTSDRSADAMLGDGEVTLERGFVASLRWLVAEGDARGVGRIAVELRALRETLATLDETRSARDESARRAMELEREVLTALAMLGAGTSVNGNGSLAQRLTRLRERIREDSEARRQLVLERDAWRSMTTLMTQTRAYVHELLDHAERGRDSMSAELRTLRDQVLELQISREHAEQEKRVSDESLQMLRARLQSWGGTVERALAELRKSAGDILSDHSASMSTEPTGNVRTSVANADASAPQVRKRVRRTYLTLNTRQQFHTTRRPLRQAVWLLLPSPTVAEWRQLYATVGATWNWTDRDRWSDRQIADRLARPDVHIFRADAALNALADEIEHGVGFVELERHPDGSVEIVYFGLTRTAQGFGLGAWLLERAVEEAWALGATRVWLHTCTDDSPHALPNYIARGFEIEREEEYDAE